MLDERIRKGAGRGVFCVWILFSTFEYRSLSMLHQQQRTFGAPILKDAAGVAEERQHP